MPTYGPYISKITLPNGRTYDIKDQEARDLIAAIQAGGLTFTISTDAGSTPQGVTWDNNGTLVTGNKEPSADTKPYIFLVPHSKDSQGNVDYYREYVTVQIAGADTPATTDDDYIWEYLGNTDIDLSNLGALAWADTATGSGTVSTADSATFSNGSVSATATYTPAGTINVTLNQTSTAASLTKADYTPAGTVSTPTITVTPATTTVEVKKTAGSVTAGSAASFTRGTFNGGSFTQGTDSFTAPVLKAEVATGTETLSISFNAGSFTQGTDSFTAATHGNDTFVANTPTAVTLPTFQEQTVATGITSATSTQPTFTGTKETGLKVTAVNYDKASVNTKTFTGTKATISSTGTASGDVSLTKSNKTVTITVNPD